MYTIVAVIPAVMIGNPRWFFRRADVAKLKYDSNPRGSFIGVQFRDDMTPLLVIVPWNKKCLGVRIALTVSVLESDSDELQFILATPLLAKSRRSAMSSRHS